MDRQYIILQPINSTVDFWCGGLVLFDSSMIPFHWSYEYGTLIHMIDQIVWTYQNAPWKARCVSPTSLDVVMDEVKQSHMFENTPVIQYVLTIVEVDCDSPENPIMRMIVDDTDG